MCWSWFMYRFIGYTWLVLGCVGVLFIVLQMLIFRFWFYSGLVSTWFNLYGVSNYSCLGYMLHQWCCCFFVSYFVSVLLYSAIDPPVALTDVSLVAFSAWNFVDSLISRRMILALCQMLLIFLWPVNVVSSILLMVPFSYGR